MHFPQKSPGAKCRFPCQVPHGASGCAAFVALGDALFENWTRHTPETQTVAQRQIGRAKLWQLWLFCAGLSSTLVRFIPVITQGWGGIVVGLISKTAGSVRKGTALERVVQHVITILVFVSPRMAMTGPMSTLVLGV